MMARLAEAMVALANALQLAINSKAEVIQRPLPFKGKRGADARRFLAAFAMWAMVQGPALNTVDQQGDAVDRRDAEWIRTALSYLQDEAAIWGIPAMEEFGAGGVPFDGQWETFREHFKARFAEKEDVDKVEPVDANAKEKLRTLWQNESTVPEYAARFKKLMTRTGYSSAHLRDCFYDHLSERIKDELAHTGRPVGTLDELVTVASDIDTRVRQRRAEKERERRCPGVVTGTTSFQPNVPFSAPDINVMDGMRTRR
jgi:hypothetical protein